MLTVSTASIAPLLRSFVDGMRSRSNQAAGRDERAERSSFCGTTYVQQMSAPATSATACVRACESTAVSFTSVNPL